MKKVLEVVWTNGVEDGSHYYPSDYEYDILSQTLRVLKKIDDELVTVAEYNFAWVILIKQSEVDDNEPLHTPQD